jgi:hypothetical protein
MINFYNGQHAYYCGVDLHKKTPRCTHLGAT